MGPDLDAGEIAAKTRHSDEIRDEAVGTMGTCPSRVGDSESPFLTDVLLRSVKDDPGEIGRMVLEIRLHLRDKLLRILRLLVRRENEVPSVDQHELPVRGQSPQVLGGKRRQVQVMVQLLILGT